MVICAATAAARGNFRQWPFCRVLVAGMLLSSASFVMAFAPAFTSHSIDPQVTRGSPRVPQGLLLAAAAAKGNKYPNLDAFCAEQEAKAVAASESWIVDATGFLEPSESAAVSEKLEGRADVSCLSVGLYRKGQGRRSRCVFSNPDLGYDAATAEADYVSYLKIDNVIPSQCDPWPNVLVNIGLSLDTVGDVLVVVNQATVYLAVAPESTKVCTRLLPKELPGTGVTVTSVSRDELDSELTDISDSDGMVVDNMEVQRVDKRK